MAIALNAIKVFHFALAQQFVAPHMQRAFQASSPKTFMAGPSGPALFRAFSTTWPDAPAVREIDTLALPEPLPYLAHSVAG